MNALEYEKIKDWPLSSHLLEIQDRIESQRIKAQSVGQNELAQRLVEIANWIGFVQRQHAPAGALGEIPGASAETVAIPASSRASPLAEAENAVALHMRDLRRRQELTKKLTDDGLIVEAGWVGFVYACKLYGAPQVQLKEMRAAFFAGAAHLFSSILTFLEPGREGTDKDFARMKALSHELDRFQEEFEAHAEQEQELRDSYEAGTTSQTRRVFT